MRKNTQVKSRFAKKLLRYFHLVISIVKLNEIMIINKK